MQKKICLLGDFAVGKTSLVRQFVYKHFDDKYISTIGVNVSRKTLTLKSGDGPIDLTMMLWDLSGSEKFGRVQTSYLQGAAGAILVCDLTRSGTLERTHTYFTTFRNINPGGKLILAANKDDLVEQHQLTRAQVETVTADLHIPHYFTSAKTGAQVETLFQHLGQLLLTVATTK